MPFGWDRNERGMSLVEVMVASGIGVTVLLAMTSMMGVMNKSFLGTRTLASRDQLMTSLGRYAGNSKALTNSAAYTGGGGFPDNTSLNGGMLGMCVNGGTSGGCVAATNSGTPISYDFVLTDTNSSAVAGTSAVPAVYDTNGVLCGSSSTSPPNSRCPILATASFKASCPGSANSCDQAVAITVTYSIVQAPGVVLDGFARAAPKSMSVLNMVPLTSSGSGVVNSLAKWITSSSTGASSVYDVSGNVGVGTASPQAKLDVVGGIKVGNDSASCTAANLGEIRYPGAANLEVCANSGSGPAWIAVGSGAGASPGPSPAPSPGTVTRRYVTQTSPPSPPYDTTITASCNAGEILTGGGTYCEDTVGTGALTGLRQVASYPSSSTSYTGTCTMDASNTGYFTLKVHVLCLSP